MKKSDLKDGMVVETRGGSKYLIRTLENGNKVLSAMEKWLMLDDGYNEDLTDDTFKDLDIVKVFKTNGTCLNTVFEERNLTLIWQEEREIDWSKVPKWTKVIAKDFKEHQGSEMLFIMHEPKIKEYPFIVIDSQKGLVGSYKYCRIHPDIVIKEEWYK